MSLARTIAARMLASKASAAPSPLAPARERSVACLPAPASLVLELPPPAPPTPAPPPRAIRTGWKGACQALCAATGRRCRLPEHRVDEPHRHERGAFTLTAPTGQTFTGRADLDRAATSRTFNPITEA